MTSKEFCKLLERNGFAFKRRSKHLIYHDGHTHISVPCHGKDLNRGLEKQLLIHLRKALEARP